MMSGWTTLCRVCRLSTHKKKKKSKKHSRCGVANCQRWLSSHPQMAPSFYENGTVSLGTQLKVSLLLSGLAVFAWPAAKRGGESNMAAVRGDAWERVYRRRRQEGRRCFQVKGKCFFFFFFVDTERTHTHSTHFLPTLTTVPVHK